MKKLLFVMDSLVAAGGERSLVALLNELDYNELEVDLQLMSYGGEFEKYVPSQVNVLPPLGYLNFLSTGEGSSFLKHLAKLCYSCWFRLGKKRLHVPKARKWWICARPFLTVFEKQYDVAIAYSQCVPTFYVVEKVKAHKKLGWVNCIYHLQGRERLWQRKFYQSLDQIVLVSNDAFAHFKGVYPEFENKMRLMPDLISAKTIERLSLEVLRPFDDDNVIKLLTVARLDIKDKGYDITLKACKILKERGLNFKWYAIGKGDYQSTIEQFIEENDLKDIFVLLGTMPNPYPYIRNCTIYVQTSRHEGFGLSIAEARLLNRPIVTTEYDSVYCQMIPEKNGLVVPIDATAVADAVQRLLNDKMLYNSIIEFQRSEKKGNVEEIKKFYQMIC